MVKKHFISFPYIPVLMMAACLVGSGLFVEKAFGSTYWMSADPAATVPSLSSSQSEIPPEVYEAAKEGIHTFASLAERDSASYGFTSSEQLQQLSLGVGYPLRTLKKSYDWRYPNSLVQQLQVTKEWEFIIEYEEQPVSFIVIAWDEYSQKYKFVSAGGDASLLASRIAQFNELLGRSDANPSLEVIRIRNWRLLVDSKDEVEYAMFEVMPGSTYLEAEQQNGSLLTAKEAIRILKQEGVLTSFLPIIMVGSLLLLAGIILSGILHRRRASRLS